MNGYRNRGYAPEQSCSDVYKFFKNVKDPRPENYVYTENRTVSELTREELETALCDAIDSAEQIAADFADRFEKAAMQAKDNFHKERFS